MDLTDALLPSYLDDLGLLDGRRVTSVRSTIRRSYCAEVGLSDGHAWFVKQARLGPDGASLAELGREAVVLDWANAGGSGADGAPLRAILPPLRGHDPANRVLITGYLTAHLPLVRAPSRSLLGRGAAVALAAHLARIHAVSPNDVSWAASLPTVASPPIATWDDVRPETLAAHPDAFAELLGHLQETPGLDESVARLRAAWSPVGLVHGDLKRDNVLWRPRRAGERADLRIIDWELAHWGDPAWDLGSVIGDYVQGWLETVSPTRTGGLADWIAGASVPYARVQAAIATFWAAYRRQARVSADAAAAVSARSVAAAGIFLVHRAMAAVMTYGTLSSGALCTLQVARRFLRSPEDAARGLLP